MPLFIRSVPVPKNRKDLNKENQNSRYGEMKRICEPVVRRTARHSLKTAE